jgi:hypothetical protein
VGCCNRRSVLPTVTSSLRKVCGQVNQPRTEPAQITTALVTVVMGPILSIFVCLTGMRCRGPSAPRHRQAVSGAVRHVDPSRIRGAAGVASPGI